MTFTKNQSAVAELYIASLGRSPDKGGLDYWVGELEGGRKTLVEIQDAFFDTNIPEVAARFPEGTTSTQFVESVYVNVFGRDSDEGGLAYWASRLDLPSSDENHLSTSALMSTMLSIAKDPANYIDSAVLSNNLSNAQVTYENESDSIILPSTGNLDLNNLFSYGQIHLYQNVSQEFVDTMPDVLSFLEGDYTYASSDTWNSIKDLGFTDNYSILEGGAEAAFTDDYSTTAIGYDVTLTETGTYFGVNTSVGPYDMIIGL